MVYCPKCKVLSEGSVCVVCGSGQVRVPGGNDYCLLTERGYMWTALLAEVLEDAGIPSVSQEVLDHAFGLRAHDRHRVYVPYQDYDRAKELLTELFDGSNGLDE